MFPSYCGHRQSAVLLLFSAPHGRNRRVSFLVPCSRNWLASKGASASCQQSSAQGWRPNVEGLGRIAEFFSESSKNPLPRRAQKFRLELHEGAQNLEALSSPHVWFLDHYTIGLPTTSLPVSSQVLCHQASGWNWKGPAQEPYWGFTSAVGGMVETTNTALEGVTWKQSGRMQSCLQQSCWPHPSLRMERTTCLQRPWVTTSADPTLQRPSATTWARPSRSAQHFFFILQVLLLLKSRGTSNITDRKGSFWKSSVMPSSPNSVSTLRGSYGKCKGRCLIRVLTLGASLFPAKFTSEVALVKCWHAFWLRRLAQSGLWHFTCKFLYKMAGSCEMLTCVSTAQSRTKCGS